MTILRPAYEVAAELTPLIEWTRNPDRQGIQSVMAVRGAGPSVTEYGHWEASIRWAPCRCGICEERRAT